MLNQTLTGIVNLTMKNGIDDIQPLGSDGLWFQRLNATQHPVRTTLQLEYAQLFHHKWLQRQAYAYRDLEYFKLEIYDLPKLKIIKDF